MSALPSAFVTAPVWRAGEMAAPVQHTLDTGYSALNAFLPGGGWPVGAMTEVLHAQPGCGEWGLLAPALAALAPWPLGTPSPASAVSPVAPTSQASPANSAVVLVGAPFVPCGSALAARHIHPARLLRVQADPASARLWAAEQALRCADVSAVLAWLPKVPLSHLRRLHMAAQLHGKLLFIFRPDAVQAESSPAPLRLRLTHAGLEIGQSAEPVLGLQIDIVKRRGPALDQPLLLQTMPLRLEALLAASRAQARRRRHAAGSATWPAPGARVLPLAVTLQKESAHVVGRFASHS